MPQQTGPPAIVQLLQVSYVAHDLASESAPKTPPVGQNRSSFFHLKEGWIERGIGSAELELVARSYELHHPSRPGEPATSRARRVWRARAGVPLRGQLARSPLPQLPCPRRESTE
jgi:hypothetical protein